MPVKVFCCYAHEDEALLNKLKAHLKPLQRQGLIDVWHDHDINAGTEWEQEIKEQLNAAQIILLLISPDFMESDYCYDIEMKRALERHEKGEACVIPIILRPVYWEGIFGTLQALPTDAKPVMGSSWHYQDEALLNVTEGIRKVVNKLLLEARRATPGQQPLAIHLVAADKTDVGKQRDQNEDRVYQRIQPLEEGDRGLFIVADGMGGYHAGEVASRLAVQKVSEYLSSFVLSGELVAGETEGLSSDRTEQTSTQQEVKPIPREQQEAAFSIVTEMWLKEAIKEANKVILRYSDEHPRARGLGCTITAALIQNDRAYVANVGDTRTYLLRNGELKVLTRDHSLVARLVEAKRIEPEDIYSHPQRNLVYRSLGAGHKTVEVDVFQERLQFGDTLLLCSDGLWEMVRPPEMASILIEAPDPQTACFRLIEAANANGGDDNISAIVVDVR